jgi:hypothetical protein
MREDIVFNSSALQRRKPDPRMCSAVYGSKARWRALLIALEMALWCFAHALVLRRVSMRPRSEINRRKKPASL